MPKKNAPPEVLCAAVSKLRNFLGHEEEETEDVLVHTRILLERVVHPTPMLSICGTLAGQAHKKVGRDVSKASRRSVCAPVCMER